VSAPPPSLRAFIVRAFLLLAPCFAAWYFIAPVHAAALGGIAGGLVELFRSGLVSDLERSGFTLSFVTTLQTGGAPGQVGLLVAEVNPLIYTYGLALFVALMLASRARLWKILAGGAVLMPFQAWGIAFDFLAQMGVLFGPEVAAQARLTGWRPEAIAFGYQAGTLIFPSLVPVLLWAGFNRAFIASLRPQAAETQHAALVHRG
jgi:hypothetical protein